MTIIKAKISDQELRITENPLVASGGVNETSIHFTFCEKWNGYIKTAVFADSNKQEWYDVMLDANDRAIVPALVTATRGRFFFGIVGIKDDIRYTTKVVQYDVVEGAILSGEEPEIPQSIMDQILAEVARGVAEREAIKKEVLTRPSGTLVKDDTTAYIKDVPALSLPSAKLQKLGGMTRKCTNVFPEDIAYGYWEINGGTGNVYFISMSGILGSREKFAVKPNTTYCVSSKSSWAVWFVDENYKSLGRMPADGWGYPYTTFTTPSTPCYAVFSSWYDGDYQYDIMINEGTEPLPYEPYFAGLRSAEVTEVESVGVNLLNNSLLTNSSNWQYMTIKAEPNTTYTAHSNAPYIASIGVYIFNSSDVADTPNQLFKDKVLTLTTNSDGIINVQFRSSGDLNILDYYYQLNKGTTALPYTPYQHNTLTIPEAVRNLDGYGWGVNADCFNYIDFEKKQFVKRVGCVDLGTLDFYKYEEGNGWFFAAVPDMVAGGSLVKCELYDFGTNSFSWSFIDSYTDKTINVTSNNFIYIKDTSYTDAITFKVAMQGVMLVYELAEPIITDISDILSADNFIAVEGDGSLTFKNENEYDVPSEVEFYINAVSGVIVDGSHALKVGDTIITEAQLNALLGMIN